MRSTLLVLLLLQGAACPHAAAPRAPLAPAAAPRAPAASLCAGRERGPVLEVAPLELRCESAESFSLSSCGGTPAISVLNCAREAMTVLRLELAPAGQDRAQGGGRIIEPAGVRIASGDRWSAPEWIEQRERRYRVMVVLRGEEGGERRLTGELVVRNPTLERARARCQACSGLFAPRGLAGITACHCRMPDAGKPCSDGDECQGRCVGSGTPGDFRCSTYRTTFGCHSTLPRGWSKGARGGLARRVPTICVD